MSESFKRTVGDRVVPYEEGIIRFEALKRTLEQKLQNNEPFTPDEEQAQIPLQRDHGRRQTHQPTAAHDPKIDQMHERKDLDYL